MIASALSFTRAMQRVYERAWRLPVLGMRATPAGLVWLASALVFTSVFSGVRAVLIDISGPILSLIVALAFAAVVWLGSRVVAGRGRLRARRMRRDWGGGRHTRGKGATTGGIVVARGRP